MSDARAIEAVTETMRSIVDVGVKQVSAGARAIAVPPHEVAASQDQRVNLFLYRTQVDASLRNTDSVGVTPGEKGAPALPLILHYLLTPYAPDGNDLVAHRLLGGALQALHSHERLTKSDLADLAPFSNVAHQFEQVRISWQPLDDREIYSLWSVFQAPYRISVAFEVRVVQIDSRRSTTAALPVLRRGSDGRGAAVSATVALPELTEVIAVLEQPAAQAGEQVELRGRSLAADTVEVLLSHPLLPEPLQISPDVASDQSVVFTMPTTMPAGFATVSLALTTTGTSTLVTNQLPVGVAPAITSPLPMTVARSGSTATVTLSCSPEVLAGQEVSLILGSQPTRADAIAADTTIVTFTVHEAVPGTFPVRLRVGGADSRLVPDRTVAPPEFDPSAKVTVT